MRSKRTRFNFFFLFSLLSNLQASGKSFHKLFHWCEGVSLLRGGQLKIPLVWILMSPSNSVSPRPPPGKYDDEGDQVLTAITAYF